MGLGVLESKSMKDVPGTGRLEDLDAQGHITIAAEHANLKRTKDGIILIPQPSDDPADPLNWPLWRRDMITLILCIMAILASTLSPILAANTITLLLWFQGESITNMALLTGWHLCGVAVAGFIFVATSRVYGKRHSFILGTVIIVISSVWAGYVGHDYKSLVAARFFQGVGLAPFEACVNAAVGDMYCVHERGKRMAFSNVCLFGGAFFTPVIVGVITDNMGWWWTFWFVAIFTGITLPFVFVFVPETSYNRVYDDKRFSPPPSARGIESKEKENVSEVALEMQEGAKTGSIASAHSGIKAIPWVSRDSLKLFHGRYTNESFWQILFRPLPLFFHPGVLYTCLIQGVMIGWTALIGVILALVLLYPPLFFNAQQTGFMYSGAFVGSIFGLIVSGFFTDIVTRWMCKLNGGIFEPEFRLVLVVPQLLFGVTGLYGFGYASANTAIFGWVLTDVFFGFVLAGLVFGAVASALYIVDAHADIEIEGFTCILIFKNMFVFALTFKAFDWLNEAGVFRLMYSAASVQVGICLLTIPMYIFGKRNRAFFAKHDILKYCRLR